MQINDDGTQKWDMTEYKLGIGSDCCGAKVYLNGICAECKEHCTEIDQDIPMGIRPIPTNGE